VWGLIGVYVKQTASPMSGSDGSAWIALALAVVLAAQTVWLRVRPFGPAGGIRPGGARPSRRTGGPIQPPIAGEPRHRH
jgi:hypothetical protein